MRNFWKIMLIAIVSMAVASCGKDDPINPNPPSPTPDKLVMVELTLAAEDMPKVRAMDENVIKDVNVYLYGKMDYHFYFPTVAAALAFETLPGDYQMYVVTNVHKDMGSLTKAELETYVVAYDAMVDDIPMTANVAVKISSSSGTFALPEIQVKRNAAKIVYGIEVGDAVAANIKLQSVQFCNIPKSTSLFGTAAASTDKNDYFDSAVLDITNPKSFADVFYMFENLQGVVSSITDQKDKSPANAPTYASYMKIYAQGQDKVIEYIVYLGENSTSDFNVRKNTNHTMNLVINGENEIDNRVKIYEGLYYGTANCIICTENQVTFDVTPYRTSKEQGYSYTGINAGNEYNAVKAGVFKISTYYAPTLAVESLSLSGNQLTIKTNGGKGNALVAIYDMNDEILWSWHVWCLPGDRPQDDEYRNNTASAIFMDRDLGDIDALRESCMYQWGRKDPFDTWDTGITTPPDIRTGTIEFATKNPRALIMGKPDDWLHQSKDDLWGGSKTDKTVYDPCPEGYRVPSTLMYTSLCEDSEHPMLKRLRIVDGTNYLHGCTIKRNNQDMEGVWWPQGYQLYYDSYYQKSSWRDNMIYWSRDNDVNSFEVSHLVAADPTGVFIYTDRREGNMIRCAR